MKPAVNGRSWFTPIDLAKIYNFPNIPANPPNVVIGVISFGGGLYGTLNPDTGILTDSDLQAYWSAIGIPINNHPKVIVKTVGGATNLPDLNDGGSTFENTLDVETIGGCYPSSKLTIVLYISPNSLDAITNVINYAVSDTLKPTVLSISWGSAEINYTNSQLSLINSALEAAANKGITICTATGDNGSSNGTLLPSCADFPSSSPFCTAVGGTKLISPLPVYNSNTIETAWSFGGGANSFFFSIPSYQQTKIGTRAIVSGTKRSVPDISSNADPDSGVFFYIGGRLFGSFYIFGGTSVAAPTMAAFFALANKKTFANIKLYKAPQSCFHDISSGSNGAHKSVVGYDNCTGRGTINGKLLLANL